jgi:hypothetical protein
MCIYMFSIISRECSLTYKCIVMGIFILVYINI